MSIQVKMYTELNQPISKEYVDFTMKNIELAGRTCYKSESKIHDDSATRFIKNILSLKHYSVVEHGMLSFRVICDRAVSHQWVRHRLKSYSQESQRYCCYTKKKFGGDIQFIRPIEMSEKSYEIFNEAVIAAESYYFNLIKNGEPPEIARCVLPNSTKTEFVVSANLRTWIEFLPKRLSKHAQADIRFLANQVLDIIDIHFPIIGDHIKTLVK